MKYNPPYGITDPDGPYINGDPSIGRAGSIPPAESMICTSRPAGSPGRLRPKRQIAGEIPFAP